MRSSSQLQPAAMLRPPHEDETEGYQTHWHLQHMGVHQHGDGSTVYPETELCQAYNITASIFPRQQKQWGFVLCKLPLHGSCLVCSTSCSCSAPPSYFTLTTASQPRALPIISPKLHGSFWWCQWNFETGTKKRSQASFCWRIAKCCEAGLLMCLKNLVSPRCSSVVVTQPRRFVSQPDSRSCPEEMLIQSILPSVLPASLISELSKRHLAELCQEIIRALPREIMPSSSNFRTRSLLHSQGCKWPWIAGNSPSMPQQGMMQPPLQSCFLVRKICVNNVLKFPLALSWGLQETELLGGASS